jgi:hypothetical protein
MISHPRHLLSFARSLFGRSFQLHYYTPDPVSGNTENGPLSLAREFEVPSFYYRKPAFQSRLMRILIWILLSAGLLAALIVYFKIIMDNAIR